MGKFRAGVLDSEKIEFYRRNKYEKEKRAKNGRKREARLQSIQCQI